MMGAEESGGFGFGMHLPERDGVYADLLLLDLFLREKAAGRWPVSKAIAHFHEVAGPSWYRRIDIHFDRSEYAEVKRRLLVDLREKAPAELAGQPVTKVVPLATNDGFKFFVADGSWLLVRTSGTEPLVRVYTEATSEATREAMITAGEKLVRGT
jgi:phosphomannomutase